MRRSGRRPGSIFQHPKIRRRWGPGLRRDPGGNCVEAAAIGTHRSRKRFRNGEANRLLLPTDGLNGDFSMTNKLKMLAIAAVVAVGGSSAAMAQCPPGYGWNGVACQPAGAYAPGNPVSGAAAGAA